MGIGLHNFSEGLAIGPVRAQAGARSASPCCWWIGFGLHNATEGFGITAPLTAEDIKPSWPMLLVLGLIGGGPTFVGTVLGQVGREPTTLYIAFLALAAGSILYVIVQLMNVNQKLGYKTLVMWMLLAGLFLGFATDFIIEAAGV